MPARTSIKKLLTGMGLGAPLRRVGRVAKERGFGTWRPLVPEEEFTACATNAIATLRQLEQPQSASGEAEFGDYVEFGVSRGTSLACMYRALDQTGLSRVRLFGFDSFEGLPDEAEQEGWTPGKYKSTLAATQRYLADAGVDARRVTLTKGWFKDTLTPATRARLGLRKASLIMVDCDIYSATVDALRFSEPLVRERAVFFFDDWRSNPADAGQQRAFDEFLAQFPQFTAEPLPAYGERPQVFLVRRLAACVIAAACMLRQLVQQTWQALAEPELLMHVGPQLAALA